MQREVQAPHLASYIVGSILEAGRVDHRLNVMLPKVIMKKPGNANDNQILTSKSPNVKDDPGSKLYSPFSIFN